MKSYDKTLTRLVLILSKLSNKELPTIKDLSEEFGVGIRTIQRDIYERLMYWPIEKNSLGQLQFIDGFSLDRCTLENDEMLLVYLAMSQIKNLSNSFESKIDNVFAKLLNPTFSSPYYINREGFEKLDIESTHIKIIESSIKNNQLSEIKSNNITSKVKPYKVVNFDGLWYLFARDLTDDKIKTYLIAKIDEYKPLDEYFSLQTDVDEVLSNVYSAWFEDGNTFDVLIKVSSSISHFFKLRKIIPSQEIIEEKSCGELTVMFKVTHYEDIDNIVKSWLPHIEVLEPVEYKNQLINELRTYISQ